MMATGTSRPRTATRIHGETSAPEPKRSQRPIATAAAMPARSCLDGVEAFVGSHVEPSGHEDDNGEADGSQRGQPWQDASRHRQHQANSTEDLREANEDYLRTG